MPISQFTTRFLFTLWLLFAGIAKGQPVMEAFKQTKTISQAEKLVQKYPAVARLFSISSDKDTNDITLPLFDKSPGYTFSIDKNTYKIIETTPVPQFRASYIYLDGSKLTLKEIDSLRTIIITSYQSGTPFYELVKTYTMDGNPTGDLDWFGEGMMMPEFESAIRRHSKGDIFTVDIPSNKWYYVALKTFDDRTIRITKLLSINTGTKTSPTTHE